MENGLFSYKTVFSKVSVKTNRIESVKSTYHKEGDFVIIIIIVIIIITIDLTHSQTILENTVEIRPQPVDLDFKNLSQYSSCSR